MSDLYSRDNLTTAEATPGLLHEVAVSFLKDYTTTTTQARIFCSSFRITLKTQNIKSIYNERGG